MLIIALLLPLISIASEKASDKKEFSLEKLQQAYKSTGSLEADFLQEVYQASLGRTKTSKGSIKLSKPNLARWEIYEPEASVMVSNGKKLSYYTPDARGKGKGQVIERNATELEKQPIFRIMTGTSPLNREFTVVRQEEVESADKGEKLTALSLKPKKKLGDIVEVQLKVNSKYLIQELNTESETGNKTKITLQNQVLGAKLRPEIFKFKPPADTEVLKN